MPDPTAHAADMTSPATIKPNEMPAFWWLNPWGYALNLKRALHAVHLLSETTEAAHQAAKTVIKQKQELADYHAKNHNGWQRKVEETLKPACPHLYEDTIGYVHWAAEEITVLRVKLNGITEDRDDYVGRVKSLRSELLEAKELVLKLVEQNEKADADITKAEARIKELEAKRKPAKKKAKYGDARDGYASLARKVLKGLAKKQGGRK